MTTSYGRFKHNPCNPMAFKSYEGDTLQQMPVFLVGHCVSYTHADMFHEFFPRFSSRSVSRSSNLRMLFVFL